MIEGPRGREEVPKSETYGANGITWAGKAGLGCRATNNVVYGNVHCGLKERGHGGTRILLEGNIIFGNGTRSTDHGIYCPADELTINRIDCGYDNGGGGYGDPARNRDDYNCYFPGKPDPRIPPGAHEVLSDPLFVDTARGDFRLKPASGCRGIAASSAQRNHENLLDLRAFPNIAQ